MAGEPAVHEECDSSSGSEWLDVSFVIPGAGRTRDTTAFATDPDM
jgi:hypothetical protein